MKYTSLPAFAFSLMLLPAAAYAQDYEAAVKSSLPDFAQANAFSGVTINVACRHLPAMDFIESHKALFEQYTGAKINFTDYPENDLRSHIVADAANKAGGFQLYCLDDNYIPLFASNKWVQPLDSVIKPAYKIDDLFDSLKSAYSWQGKLSGLPIYSEVTILYYRKDLLAAKNIAVPKTIAELEDAAVKLKNAPRTYGIALRGLRGEGMNVYTWTEWLRSYGGDFLGPQMQPVFNSPEAIEGTEHYAKIIHDAGPPGSGTWGWPQVSSSFAAGRVAMTVESTAFYPTFNDPKQSNVVGNVGYAVVPAGPKGAYPANYAIGLAVAASVDPSSKAFTATSDFLQWATSQQMEFARTAQGIGNEDRKSVNQSALLKSKLDPAYIEAVSEGQKITKTNYRPMIPQWREMGDIIGAHIESVFTGSTTAKDALDAAAAEVSDRFKTEGVLNTPRQYEELFPSN
ncbi:MULTISPECIES: ABC transporter substrate-binding protein [unclassified Acidisoma]|jgi:multiple sugar transport system substrate-binding protein|uniref:ABC transporter substrate-binding protein n=1 Tax=unclassified Acidisoma TaxID=2634065 RepID=UPI00131EA40E|nr:MULTISPECIES: sugar ABC transporter substrate-binding protein [unclassified Acidisoma]